MSIKFMKHIYKFVTNDTRHFAQCYSWFILKPYLPAVENHNGGTIWRSSRGKRSKCVTANTLGQRLVWSLRKYIRLSGCPINHRGYLGTGVHVQSPAISTDGQAVSGREPIQLTLSLILYKRILSPGGSGSIATRFIIRLSVQRSAFQQSTLLFPDQ